MAKAKIVPTDEEIESETDVKKPWRISARERQGFRDQCAAMFVNSMLDPRSAKSFPDDGHSSPTANSSMMIRSAIYLADRLVETLHPTNEE